MEETAEQAKSSTTQIRHVQERNKPSSEKKPWIPQWNGEKKRHEYTTNFKEGSFHETTHIYGFEDKTRIRWSQKQIKENFCVMKDAFGQTGHIRNLQHKHNFDDATENCQWSVWCHVDIFILFFFLFLFIFNFTWFKFQCPVLNLALEQYFFFNMPQAKGTNELNCFFYDQLKISTHSFWQETIEQKCKTLNSYFIQSKNKIMW